MEYWDAYDKEGHKLDETLIRGEVIPQGVYHLVSEVLVRHIDGDILLMQRDFNKNYGGMFESSAGGSVLKGETALEGLIRELKEETGITSYVDLTHLKQSIYDDSIFNTYICITDIDKNSITFQEGETVDYKWITTEQYKQYAKSDDALPYQIERLQSYIDTL